MPSAQHVIAATPKCPSRHATGATHQRCAVPMIWNHRRGVWVCPNHPHMEVWPLDFESATMAPKQERTPIVMGEREVWQ